MNSDVKTILFLGIGGVSMHQLALSLKSLDYKVLGYDANKNEYTKLCEENGIKVTDKFSKEFLQVDMCVKTGAISGGKYITELKKRGIDIVDRAEILGWLSSKFKNVIAVAGTHGKSTTASLIYEILRLSGKKVSCHIGADVYAARFNVKDEYLVIEACEYNKSFLSLFPTISVVTNVEADHIECYGSLFNLKNAFSVFLRRGKLRFVYNEKSTQYLSKIKDVNFISKTNLNISPKIKGEHNLKNISLAIEVCRSLGIDDNYIISAVEGFKGVPRRYEFVGNYENKKIYIDYAHHPTEISMFAQTFSNEHKNSLFVFQPHTYSRTKLLLKQFIKVLSKIENLIIYKEYPAREKPWQGLSAYELYLEIKKINSKVKYCATSKSVIKNLKDFSNISFVGAGDINLIAQKIVKSN